MELTLEQAERVVDQLQTAHRLAVAFYERLLQRLAATGEELEMEFWYWRPAHTQRPGSSTTRPNKNWPWDYVPLFASRHVYRRISGEAAAIGDTILALDVHVDDQFRPEKRKAAGVRRSPDPTSMGKGQGTFTATFYVCMENDEKSTMTLWEKTKEHPAKPGWSRQGSFVVTTVALSLARYLVEPEKVTMELKQVLESQPRLD